MNAKQRYLRLIALFVLLVGLTALYIVPYVGSVLIHRGTAQAAATTRNISNNSSFYANSAPTPFMYRPYYGNLTIGQRTTSFVDHDKPWYANDGTFVRYDGTKWTNVAIGSCTGGVNCYDGHNGYDLNLRFEPVLSVAAGTVIRAGWYDPSNHQSALGLWTAVDHGNGYVTAYGHMSALTVYNGEKVGTQWQVGTSGTTGSSTGPHLHMATYYLPNWSATDPFGWTGNYPDPNVVPDRYLWVANPGTSNTVPNLNANGSAVYPSAVLVDDGSNSWSSTGSWLRDTTSTDINGALHYTATSNGPATATATWQPRLPGDGYYEVGAFVNDNHASSSWAPYTVYSGDANNASAVVSHNIYVDESHIGSFQGPYGWENTGPQWVSLGTYYFRAGQPGRVVLSNATGENGLQISADAVEFVPVSGLSSPPTPTPTPAPSPSYGFSVTIDGTPAAMLPNSTVPVSVTIKNTGNFTWNASGSGMVQALYRWLNSQNQVVATGRAVNLPQNVNVNASTTLNVPVQTPSQVGAYTLQWDLVQNGKAFSQEGAQAHNDSVEVAGYAESFNTTGLPTTLPPGATVQVNVTAQNKGAVTWPATGSASVTLGYSWLDTNGNAVSSAIVNSSNVGMLSTNVATGHSISIPITLHTPVLAGSYKLVYDLQQQRTRFAARGATPLTVAMTLTPTLPRTYYFAEGYIGAGTTEYLSLTNPSSTQNTITVTYLFAQGAPLTRTYQVSAQAHTVLNINQEVGASQSVSMIVQGSQSFVAERNMYIQKGSFVAASDSVGSPVLSTNWYFAEGNTTYGWNTLLAVLNPSTQPATITVHYLTGSAGAKRRSATITSTYTIPAQARGTIVLNSALPNSQFGMAITASSAVLVERPEYLVSGTLRGGNSVVGATAPQTTWYFGGGNTSTGFTERLVLSNPSSNQANVRIRYLSANGQVVNQSVSLPSLSRIEVNVNAAFKQGIHSTVITSNVPIVAERQDFFNTNFNGSVQGSTTVMGSSHASTSWYIAQGDTGNGYAEYLALANPNNVQTQVQVVYYLASGSPIVKTHMIGANARLSISLLSELGSNRVVGIAVYATSPVVTEQVLFFNIIGVSGGYTSTAYGN
jgi:murein DD-endopeptidase MepM/ murein hydrolase activator NlpD